MSDTAVLQITLYDILRRRMQTARGAEELSRALAPDVAELIRADRVAIRKEPKPEGKGVDVAALVHADLEARIEHGRLLYGERLTTHNGRDALVDAYQEALDLAVYLRQVLHERGFTP